MVVLPSSGVATKELVLSDCTLTLEGNKASLTDCRFRLE
ncbi:hypothetical protein AB395_00002804 [Sinorhizobium fredii CCBAU 45436]|nr:hypothetical protein AB395_00002804 [Sinorhizobium fredii CCBAU 45436]